MKSHTQGMMFVEVVVWIGIMVMITSVMTLAIINIYKSSSYTFSRAEAVYSARRGLEEVSQLVREATYSDSGGYPIIAIATSTMTIYADYDNDGSAERVRIYLDGDTLNRGVIEPAGIPAVYTGAEATSTIVHNIQNITASRNMFTYYDRSGAEVTDFDAVLEPVFVDVALVANTGRNAYVSDYELRGSAFMRNLKN